MNHRTLRTRIAACLWVIAAPAVVLFTTAQSHANFIVFNLNTNGGLTGFNTTAGAPPISIDFDDVAAETTMNGMTIRGVLFEPSATGAPLIVVPGNDTFTPSGFVGVGNIAANKLFPTSGTNVLSPGGRRLGPGPNNPIENDDLILTFQTPLTAFGFDMLSQSGDGTSLTQIQVFNQDNSVLYSGTIGIGGNSVGAPGRADFWGVVATGSDWIARIKIDERDNNSLNPDANIGFDSFRFFATSVAVPEPTSLALFVAGTFVLAGAGWRRRRNHRPATAVRLS